ncbi:hypothetical protein [Vineibacter terrae]|uniref:hypothetical protein n=1 Tax=Vineibacter terrae TaxID=2586908 RepID=UPI002E356996|nr:hypothetical protein [Vineibacter terrae]HEX2890434.1 hypothetical protein [Vineibacter terrae]
MVSWQTRRTARSMQREAQELRRRMQRILATMEQSLASGGADAKHAIEDSGRTFLSLGSALVDHLADDAIRAADSAVGEQLRSTRDALAEDVAALEDAIRARPFCAVSIAFALGWLSAHLNRRRR